MNAPYLSRHHLEHKLREGLSLPLTVVTGFAGCGKTAEVRRFLETEGCSYIWIGMHEPVGVTPEDYFWYLLQANLSHTAHDNVRNILSQPFPRDSIRVSRLLDELCSFTEHRPIILVLDDYHLIESPAVNAFLRRVIDVRIPWLHIFLLGRRQPSMGVEELVFKNAAVSLNGNDFLLTSEEISEYLTLIGYEGSNDRRETLLQLSRGWFPAIFTIVSGSQEGRPVREAVFPLLKAVFLDAYDKDTRHLLLLLSLFTEINADQIVYVFQEPCVLTRLEQLRAENPYIERKDGDYILREPYKSMLSDELKLSGLDTTDTMQRAAEWFSVHSDQSMAIKFWHLLREYGFVLHDLESSNTSKMSAFDFDLINQAFSRIDSDVMMRYPIATLKYVFYHARYGDMNLARKTAVAFYRFFSTHEHPNYSRKQLMAELYLIFFVMCYSNVRVMMYFTHRAHELLDGGRSLIFNRDYVTTFGFPHFSAAFFRAPGEYRYTVELLTDRFHYHTENTGGMGTGCEYLCSAEYWLETGYFSEVKELALKAVYQASTQQQACITVGAKLIIARLAVLEGRPEEAKDVLEELSALKKIKRDVANLDVIDNAIGYIQALLGRADDIPAWIRNTDTMLSRTKYQGAGFSFIVYGKYLLLKGENLRFDALYDAILSRLRLYKCQMAVIHHMIHHAICSLRLFGEDAGAAALQDAFEEAEEDDILMPFIENYSLIRPMMDSRLLVIPDATREIVTSYGRRYIGYLPEARRQAEESRILSPREVEVLALIEKGYNNASIGNTLFISQNTVKRHIQNIYTKLGVNNKVAAIRKFKGEI